ncbi:MAG: hypothetical protein H6Q75_1261 [Firmicutes bacterium]|nr:hypothetical protein [Bacillota bacterium]
MKRITMLVLVLLFVLGSSCFAGTKWEYLTTNQLGEFYVDNSATQQCTVKGVEYIKIRVKVLISPSVKWVDNIGEDEYTINTYVINKSTQDCYLQSIERYNRGDRLMDAKTYPEKWRKPGEYNIKDVVKAILNR